MIMYVYKFEKNIEIDGIERPLYLGCDGIGPDEAVLHPRLADLDFIPKGKVLERGRAIAPGEIVEYDYYSHSYEMRRFLQEIAGVDTFPECRVKIRYRLEDIGLKIGRAKTYADG